MKYQHFQTLKPLCPACVTHHRQEEPLQLGKVVHATEHEVLEGTLVCGRPECGSVYPIIDGIPILVADLAHYLNQHAHEILWRNDLDHVLQSCIGDALGAGVVFDNNRHYLSAYVDGHYRDMDPLLAELSAEAPVMRFLADDLESAPGPKLDVGCSVGRITFELGIRAPSETVLGIDLNFTMLRFARRLTQSEAVPYPRKRVGVVYDHHAISYPASHGASNVDFWACDACALPFSEESFGQVTSLNVLDCVPSPTQHLQEILRLLRPEGRALLSTPFDWSAPVTPMHAWLGGHSQHNEWHGESSEILFETLGLLKDHEESHFEIQSKRDIPWEVRIHQRNTALYHSLLLDLKKIATGETR